MKPMKAKSLSIDDKIASIKKKVEATKLRQLKEKELAQAKLELARLSKSKPKTKGKVK